MPTPSLILFAQHGWADNGNGLNRLAQQIAPPNTHVVAPTLSYVQTWLGIDPLVDAVEALAQQTLGQFPEVPLRIVGHSMGGLIWLEVLQRHPDWWPLVQSLVLVASPVGGSSLARIIDPLGLGLGVAKDLGQSRRSLAETIAAKIPTLTIAGDYDGGSDGTVNIESSKFRNAKFICLPNLSHPAMRSHVEVARTIREFWQSQPQASFPNPLPPEIDHIIHQLQDLPGMTAAHYRDFAKAIVRIPLKDGFSIRTWNNPTGIPHIFIGNASNQCVFAGYAGWSSIKLLQQLLLQLKQQ